MVLELRFVYRCVFFVLYYKEEKSSKIFENCFCHSRDGKVSRLSKILQMEEAVSNLA